FGGLVHLKKTGTLPALPLHADVMNSDAVAGGKVYDHNNANNGNTDGSYLLPMAFSEGSPTHPSYGAGHATVAGACVTILKAWFKESTRLVDLGVTPVQQTDDGFGQLTYLGAYLGNMPARGEVKKLVSRIGFE